MFRPSWWSYNKTVSSINVAIIILFDSENIAFDASLVQYINNTNIPPVTIMNRMYENQNLLYIVLLIRHTIVLVSINSISPMVIGCLQAAPSVHYTTSCKHSLVLLRMGEIIARNMLS